MKPAAIVQPIMIAQDGEAQPAIVEQRLQPDVVRVLAKDLAEDQRADAERMLQRHLEADAVAGEAAEPGAVIVLGELGAVLNSISATPGICRMTMQRDDQQRDRQRCS